MNLTLSGLEVLLKTELGENHVFQDEAEKAPFPYAVYHAYRERGFHADNKWHVKCWRVQVDYYTKNRADQKAERISELLEENGVPHTHSRVWDTEIKAVRHIYDCDGVMSG